MKIEEIKNVKRKDNYFFPLSKGYNRLLMVFTALIAIVFAIQQDYDDMIIAFIVAVFVELLIYVSVIWVYHGFKDSEGKN